MFTENIMKLLGLKQLNYNYNNRKFHREQSIQVFDHGFNIESLQLRFIYLKGDYKINLRKVKVPSQTHSVRFSLGFSPAKDIEDTLNRYKKNNIKILEIIIASKLRFIKSDTGSITLLNTKFDVDFNDDSILYYYNFTEQGMIEEKLMDTIAPTRTAIVRPQPNEVTFKAETMLYGN